MIDILAIYNPPRRARYQLKMVNTQQCRQYYSDRELARPYSRFIELCKQLAAGGFTYQVRISGTDGIVDIEITGTAPRFQGKTAQPARRRISIPAKRTADFCCGKKMEAQKELRRQMSDAQMAEVEYWTELESLAETRDRWKPGLGPEVDKADMEVVAA